MAIWEFGLDAPAFAAVQSGTKTIEGRLNRGKFAQFQAADLVKIRRDYRDSEGVLRDGQSDAARVKVVAVRRYDTFLAMINTEGVQRVASSAMTVQEAADAYNSYYSADDQKRYGVLAVEIKLVN